MCGSLGLSKEIEIIAPRRERSCFQIGRRDKCVLIVTKEGEANTFNLVFYFYAVVRAPGQENRGCSVNESMVRIGTELTSMDEIGTDPVLGCAMHRILYYRGVGQNFRILLCGCLQWSVSK